MYTPQTLYENLQNLEVIPREELDNAFIHSQDLEEPFEKVLVDRDLISDNNLGQILSELYALPFIRLSQVSIDQKILNIIPEVVAKKHLVIAFKKDEKGLHVATSQPNDAQMLDFIKRKTGLPIIVSYATKKDIKDSLVLYLQDVKKAFDKLVKAHIEEAKEKSNVESPIIELSNTILNYAYQNKASDVHIEPFDQYSLIRFRVDGILHDIVKLPIALHPRITSRIRVMAKLRTDKHQAAQDGKLKHKIDNEEFDVRVSIMPTTEGNKIVMRLLSASSRQFSLNSLGFSAENLARAKQAYQKTHGMILVAGPTGSGKTTTLYAFLKLLNKRGINITTIEDPVEYDMLGVNQIQVNPETELTFAKGLRSIVRQDPDVILVGEIRDKETAGIAVNAAMTGHLVLSTLHTNDAATAIPRLLNMGIEPSLLASTINIVIAQRLVRKIHTVCRESIDLDVNKVPTLINKELVRKVFGQREKVRIYQGKGCAIDHKTGYEGRIGILEAMLIDDEIKQAIVEHKNSSEIKKIAVKNGMMTMTEDGLNKVKEGVVTIEEILRVVNE